MGLSAVAPGAPSPVFNTGGIPLWAWLQENQTPLTINQVLKDRQYLLSVPGKQLRRVTAQSNGADGVGTVWIKTEGIPTTSKEYVNKVLSQNDTISKLYEIPAGATSGFIGGKAKRKGTKRNQRKQKKRKGTARRKRARTA